MIARTLTRADYDALRRARYRCAQHAALIREDRAYGYGAQAEGFHVRDFEALSRRDPRQAECAREREWNARQAMRRRNVLHAIHARNFFRDRFPPLWPGDPQPILRGHNRAVRESLLPIREH